MTGTKGVLFDIVCSLCSDCVVYGAFVAVGVAMGLASRVGCSFFAFAVSIEKYTF